MREVFYEETSVVQDVKSAKSKYIFFNILSIIPYIGIIVWFYFMFFGLALSNKNIFLQTLFFIGPAALMYLLSFYASKIRDNCFSDYDYSFVSGSIRISRVINGVKRKFVIKFDTDHIEKIGKYKSQSYERIERLNNIKKKVLTANKTPEEEKSYYYFFVSNNTGKYLLIIECTQLFIANVLSFCKRHVKEDELR